MYKCQDLLKNCHIYIFYVIKLLPSYFLQLFAHKYYAIDIKTLAGIEHFTVRSLREIEKQNQYERY